MTIPTSPRASSCTTVNLSARLAREQGLLTSGTFGPPSSGTSASVSLTDSLGSRLAAETGSCGSTLYALTWKMQATPAGRLFFLLRASVRRTSGTGSGGAQTGWPSPTKANADGSQMGKEASSTGRRPDGSKATVSLNQVAATAGWPTPAALDGSNGRDPASSKSARGSGGVNLTTAAELAGWATPQKHDAVGGKTPEQIAAMRERTGAGVSNLNEQVHMAGWSPPKAEDAESTGMSAKRLEEGKTPDNLHSQTSMLVAGYATPAARDWRTPNHQPYATRDPGSKKGEQLNNQLAHVIPGASLNGLSASTGGKGLLNPRFSSWLQGYPPIWDILAPKRSGRTTKKK